MKRNTAVFFIFCFLLIFKTWALDHSINVIKDDEFLNLTGFIKKGLIVKKRINLNQEEERSPDQREFSTPKMAFDINYNLFLNDKEYKCRRPSYYSYFKNKFNQDPYANIDCSSDHQINMISEKLSSTPISIRNINPNRIYQIHYLFAGKGKEVMSRFGHAMYRLIICGANTTFGPDCLNDYKEHIVLSFRANVQDPTLDYKKGIDGSYNSELFLMNMHEVVDEYTKGEFRDVISLPLNLSRDEIQLFTLRFLETFWSYKGKYFFFTNNCATEALNLLKVAASKNKTIQNLEVTTPLELFNKLSQLKLTDINLLNDRKNAIKKGYLFEGVSVKLQNSLQHFLKEDIVAFDQFANNFNAEARLKIYQDKLSASNNKMLLLANALRIEEQISQHQEQMFAKKIGEAIFGKNKVPELEDSIVKEKIEETRSLYNQIVNLNTKTKGYGIPFNDEIATLTKEELDFSINKINNSSEELKELAFKYFPNEVQEMKATYNNRAFLMTEISKIN